MRKVAVTGGLLAIGAFALFALKAAAIPPPPLPTSTQTPGPTTPPPASTTTTVRVVAFTNLSVSPTPQAGVPFTPYPYRGGPIDVSVDLENTGLSPASIQVRIAHETTLLEQTVTVPPRGAGTSTAPPTHVKFTDAKGVDESCGPHTYLIKIVGPGADTRDRRGIVTPTCAWAAKVEDAWNMMTPDRVEDAKKGKAYVNSVVVDSAPMCRAGMKLTANVMNRSAKPGSSLIVTAKTGATVKAQSLAFALPAEASKRVPLVGAGGVFDSVDIGLLDPTNNLTASIATRSLVVRFERACHLDGGTLTF